MHLMCRELMYLLNIEIENEYFMMQLTGRISNGSVDSRNSSILFCPASFFF